MLMRYDPFRELDRLTDGLARPPVNVAPLDAYRDGETFHVAIDLPGIEPSEIDLTVERNVLTVRSARSTSLGEGAEVLVAERPQGEMTRRLFLGESLDTDRIEASYDRGVLHLAIPVAAQARARKVEISSREQGVIDVAAKAQPAGNAGRS